MPEGQVLEFSAVTKRFGAVTAVDGFTARVEPGLVTGFLGPNGAGKTTTLRVLLGLVRATSGTATIGGLPYAKLANPLQSVGAVLEASSFHPGRTAANHLKVYAQAAGLPASRVDEALGLVGLADVAGRKVGGYSLGMKQRLGLAYALLGDPGVLVLDEPANGLDPEGIKWMRGLLRDLARQGRTVLVSSHLLAEVQQTVDSLLIIATGRLVFQGALDELTNPDEFATVVDSPDRSALAGVLTAAGVEVEVLRSGLTVRGLDPASVGRLAADAGVPLSSLQRRGPALEEVFLDLVNGVRVHASAAGAGPAAAGAGLAAAAAVEAADAEAVPAEAAPEEATEAEATEVAAEADAGAPVAAGAAAAAVLAGDSADADADNDTEADVDAETDAEAPAAAGFAVAGTGVIDIIPVADETSDPDVADDEVHADGAEAGAEGDGAPDDGDDSAEPAADDAVTEDSPEEAPHDVERPWEEYIRTDSDEEADRFFSSFDADQAAAAAAANSAAAPEDAHSSAESEAPEDHPDQPPFGNADADAPPVDPGHVDNAPESEEPTVSEPPIEADTDEAITDEVVTFEPDVDDSDDAPSDETADEPNPDTSEFGTIGDLSPDWSEEPGAADPRDADDSEGGEQR
ncbi:ATP-binding cassette domain-containing protein [Microbacterium sp. P5_E9]